VGLNGKDYFSTTALIRVIYELYCLKRPTDTLGLGRGEIIHIVPISHTKEAAQRVVFQGIVRKLSLTPFWKGRFEVTKEEIRFPGKDIIIIAGGSNENAALGLNVWAALMDEGNFFAKQKKGHQSAGGQKEDKSESIYDSLRRRIRGTYSAKGLRGRLFMISSKKSIHDFTERRLREAVADNDPSVFVRDYCLASDTKVPLLDGSTPTIKELAEKYQDSEERFWVYSIDPATGLVVPGAAHHPHLTKEKEPVFKVTLDNGEWVRVTGNHPFMLRSGDYKKAEDLKPGDSLMPLYRRTTKRGYEEIGHPGLDGKWQMTHKMSAIHRYVKWPKRGSDGKPVVVHHEDFNKRNNNPDNLSVMEWDDHQQLHAEAMQPLLDYVRSDKHRKWASDHMKALHKDPAFAAARDGRMRKLARTCRQDPVFVEKQRRAASKTLRDFHSTELGGQRQTDRNIKRWDKVGRKITIDEIETAAKSGKNIRKLAEKHDCTISAINQTLRRAGLDSYSKLRVAAGHASYDRHKVQPKALSEEKAPGNHKVVSIEPDGVDDVYDLSVERYENFALDIGAFVHNSTWDVRPGAFQGQKWWRAAVSQKIGRVRVLEDGEEPEDHEIWFKFPDEYHKEFINDPAGAARDIAGIALESFRPFFSNREAIADMQKPTRGHPFHLYEWVTSREITPIWENIVMNNVHGDPVPRCCPNAHRHCHMDLSKNQDATGFCVGHTAGETQVSRRDPMSNMMVEEDAPIVHIDLCLRIMPPHAGEIEHELVRALIYKLREGGLPIRSVSADRWMGLPNLQLISRHGFKTEEISTQRTLDPYLAARSAMYERRIESPMYPFLAKELRELELNDQGTKVDHPRTGCFAGDTKVRLLDGRSLTFEQLVEEYGSGKKFYTYTMRDGAVSVGTGYAPRLTAKDAPVVAVRLDNGEVVRCTPDHRFMLRDGAYREAKDLRSGDALMPHRAQASIGLDYEVLVEVVTPSGHADVYDISVEETSNFALDAGVFVHNSKDVADAFAATVFFLSKNWRHMGIGGVSHGVSTSEGGVSGEAVMTVDGNFRWPDEPPLPIEGEEGGEGWNSLPTYII